MRKYSLLCPWSFLTQCHLAVCELFSVTPEPCSICVLTPPQVTSTLRITGSDLNHVHVPYTVHRVCEKHPAPGIKCGSMGAQRWLHRVSRHLVALLSTLLQPHPYSQGISFSSSSQSLVVYFYILKAWPYPWFKSWAGQGHFCFQVPLGASDLKPLVHLFC